MRYVDPDGRYSWDQFKADIMPAVNCDFGFDYTQYAANAWANKNYFTAVLYELDATCEMAYDLLACYGGTKALGAIIKASAMLKTTLSALSPSSTVVLGRYSEGTCGGYTKMADKLEASYFQLPDKIFKILEKVKVGESNLGKIINEKWLDGVVNSSARILLNFNPSDAKKGTAYYMEVQKLTKEGYDFVKTTVKGIECWEAIK